MLLSACSSPQTLDDYAEMQPHVDLKTYFNGPIKAWGLIQEPSGKVISRFDVMMHGSWQGDVGT
ncbi:MAG: DUF3833 family protein, partial [Alphaproteobacteria bacterium]|nr:DUF3833 family protein [Alphaproteobacteria bacterium]